MVRLIVIYLCCLPALADINKICLSNIMAFGTGSELLFIEGQDFMIVWLGRVITENRVGFRSCAATDFVSVVAPGS